MTSLHISVFTGSPSQHVDAVINPNLWTLLVYLWTAGHIKCHASDPQAIGTWDALLSSGTGLIHLTKFNNTELQDNRERITTYIHTVPLEYCVSLLAKITCCSCCCCTCCILKPLMCNAHAHLRAPWWKLDLEHNEVGSQTWWRFSRVQKYLDSNTLFTVISNSSLPRVKTHLHHCKYRWLTSGHKPLITVKIRLDSARKYHINLDQFWN